MADPIREKHCNLCKSWKPRDAFGANRTKKDGLASACRQCRHEKRGSDARKVEQMQRYRRRHPDRYREQEQRKREKAGHKERQRKAIAKYRGSEKGKRGVAARAAVRAAIKSGQLTRGACERCGSTKNVQGHHSDYDRQLDVKWFCSVCHGVQHQKTEP